MKHLPNQAWVPTASVETLKRRAGVLQKIRNYFNETEAFEVETPVLSHHGGTDQNLAQWVTAQGLTLHTSPEFAMKRLLAAGSGDIFQICRVFREDESGRKHNPEFTMLEWYRLGKDDFELMTDVGELIHYLNNGEPVNEIRMSYQEAFEFSGLPNPHSSSVGVLRSLVEERLCADPNKWSKDDCLDALMSMIVEPSLPADSLVYIYHYPGTQAALAQRFELNGSLVARRFELYWQGMELANGYFELTDSIEQEERFKEDASFAMAQGKKVPSYDANLIDAMKWGLPMCSGVALGVDRLLMILLNKNKIEDVIAIPFKRC